MIPRSRSSAHFPSAVYTLLLVLLVSLGAQAQKVHVTYNKSLDFSRFKTYAWAPRSAVAHPMLAADVMGAIEDQLKAKGFQKVDTNPDLIVQVYGSIDQDSTFYSNDPLYMGTGGIPPFDPSATGPALAATGYYGNTTVTIHKGELVVDLIQAAAKQIAWRGMATESVSNKPEKLMDEVNTAIAKMFREYPPKK